MIGKKIAQILPTISVAAAAIRIAIHTRMLHRIPEVIPFSGEMPTLPTATLMAAQNPAYVAKAQEAYGLTAEQIQGLTVLHSLNNFIPVTIGNILGGMVFVGIPCYFIYKKKWQKWHEESKNA